MREFWEEIWLEKQCRAVVVFGFASLMLLSNELFEDWFTGVSPNSSSVGNWFPCVRNLWDSFCAGLDRSSMHFLGLGFVLFRDISWLSLNDCCSFLIF